MSGGRQDDFALGIGHKANGKIVIDLLKQYKPPCVPNAVIEDMCDYLKRYKIHIVTGDNYAAEWTASAFKANGVGYRKADKSKNLLYGELLPVLCSGGVELLDNEKLIDQLANLERRTRSGGRDIIDHPPGAHDDLSNVVAGVSDRLNQKRIRIGGLRHERSRGFS